MKSIQEILLKIKIYAQFPSTDLLIVLIIVLVGFAGFGLGRLSIGESEKTPISVTQTPQGSESVASVGSAVESVDSNTGEEVVASKNGSKYHFPWCSGAQRIADANRIVFPSIQSARAAGYTPAANCKGLE